MPDQEAYDIERKKIRSQAESVKTYIRATYQEPILSAAQEVYLFKKYNYLKYQAALIQKTFKKDFRNHRRRKFRHLLKQAEIIRNQIAAANYRLGVSIVAKLRNNCVEDDELVNEAYLRIWLTIPKFDLKYGWKFSTYATYAINNNLAQKFKKDYNIHTRYLTGTEPDRLLDDDFVEEVAEAESRVKNKAIAKVVMRILRRMDRDPARQKHVRVIKEHFGLENGGEGKVLEKIAQDLKVTRGRIRQIKRQGLAELKTELLAKGLYI
jgi:RNA polymerase primary sigma factor/RNA polymerase sigma factor